MDVTDRGAFARHQDGDCAGCGKRARLYFSKGWKCPDCIQVEAQRAPTSLVELRRKNDLYWTREAELAAQLGAVEEHAPLPLGRRLVRLFRRNTQA